METSSFSKIGFILAASGSAVGLGNIWKFPYTAGEHGGASFILIYLIASLIIGIPALILEFNIAKGKDVNKGIVNAYTEGTTFKYAKIAPIVGGLSALFIISFYCIVVGWIFKYFFLSISGNLPVDTASAGEMFGATASGQVGLGLSLFVFAMLVNYFIVKRGLIEGIEKVSKIFMTGLFILFILLLFYALTFDGSSKAIDYMLAFDWSKINFDTVQNATGQAFFSLSVGAGTMVAYSLGMHPKQNIASTAITIAVIDTLIAILAGLVIFSFVFEFGAKPTAGPGLIFVVLPSIFHSMGAIGPFVATAFFTLFIFAAITSSISMLEASSSMLQSYGINKKKAIGIMTVVAIILGTIALLSINKELGEHLKLFGMSFFDFLDFLAEKIGMELATLLGAIIVGWYTSKEVVKSKFGGYINDTLFEIWYMIIKYLIPAFTIYLLVTAFIKI